MFDLFFRIIEIFWSIGKIVFIPLGFAIAVFLLMCGFWYLIFRFRDGMVMPPSGRVKVTTTPLLWKLFVQVPRRFMLDKFTRESNYFYPRGIHIFCGEQGSGKTIGVCEAILKLQKEYPDVKVTTNFDLKTENAPLARWQMLLNYNNGHQGVIAGIDEIQNWFMSGNNKLPVEMLEIVTQNRKNNRVIYCTSQVFTKVNKGIREQVSMVYNPHTFFNCFTVVVKRKPEFDAEGNVINMKYRGMYSFVHTDELRESYDTYKVIHTLAREGFKDSNILSPVPKVNVKNVMAAKTSG